MAMTIKELESQLSGLQTYTPETEDALRQRAENIYNPQYQQDLQSIRDSLQQGINQQNRNMISAGMQRSSYGQSAIAALRGQGLKAEAQLGAQRDANIATLLNQLIEGEKDRKLNADQNRDNLLLQLYQLANKGSGKGAATPTTSDKSNFMNWFRNASDFEKELYQMSFANDAQKLAAAGAARDAARARAAYQNNAAGEYRDEGSTIPSGLSKASMSDTSWLKLPKATVGIK